MSQIMNMINNGCKAFGVEPKPSKRKQLLAEIVQARKHVEHFSYLMTDESDRDTLKRAAAILKRESLAMRHWDGSEELEESEAK